MKQVLILLCTVYCSLYSAAVQAQQWGWFNRVYEYDSPSITYPLGMDVDAEGNIYYSSSYLGTPVFPNAVTLNAPALNKLQTSLCKVSPTGTYLWARRLNGVSISNATLCLTNGNVANCAGTLSGNGYTSITFNGITYNRKYAGTVGFFQFVLIYDKDGNELFAKPFESKGGINYSTFCSVANDIYYTLQVEDTLWYDNTYIAMPAGTTKGLFRIKIDGTNGNVTEVLRLGTGHALFNNLRGIVNENRETFLYGIFSTAYDFGNGVTVSAAGGRKSVIAKFDATGKALWVFNTSQPQLPNSDFLSYRGVMTFDENNNLYLALCYSNKIQVDGTVYSSLNTDVNNHMIIALDGTTGKVRHVSHFNKTSGVYAPEDGIMSIKSNGKGFIYAVGTTTGMEHFGDFYYQNYYAQDLAGTYTYTNDPNRSMCFLVKMDTSGVVNKFRFYGSTVNNNFASYVDVFGDNAYLGLRAASDIYFDTPSLTLCPDQNNPVLAYDAVLAVFNDCNAQISTTGNVLTASSGTAYQWYLNGTAISGETNQTYSLPVNAQGNYTVEVTFAGGCVSRSATLPIKQVVTGTVEASAVAALSAYPNPATDQLTLAVSNPGNGATVNLTIYNSEGQQMMMAQYPNWGAESEYITRVKDFPQGLYFVKMACGEQSLNAKFIKQ